MSSRLNSKFKVDKALNSRKESITYESIIQVYHNFAYSCCCIPYKILRNPRGNYEQGSWWFQKLLCHMLSGLYMYLIVERFITRVSILFSKSESSGGNNPYFYLRVFEACNYINMAFVMLYSQYTKCGEIMKYMTALKRFSTKQRLNQAGLNASPKIWLYQSSFLKVAFILLTILSLSNSFIAFNNLSFNYNSALRNARKVFLWQARNSSNLEVDNSDCENFSNLFLVAFYTAAYALRGMKDMYSELFLLTSIVPLWLIGEEFSVVVKNHANFRKGVIKSIRTYLRVSRISRLYSETYGYVLFCHLMNYLIRYSTELDKLFVKSKLGSKIYEIEHISLFLLIYGCGCTFAYRMSSLLRLTRVRTLSSATNKNSCNMLNFLFARRFCDIKAKFLPINVETLSQFLAQVMVMFLICVQSNLNM